MKAVGVALLVLLLGVSEVAAGADHLWALLKGGGQVVLLRHAVTTPGVGDPPGMRLDDCSTQRNLTDEGRAHARRAGQAFRDRGIRVDRVLASPWCRCVETAQLAFGKAEAAQSLSNLFGRSENQAKQVREMQALAGKWRGKGNLVLVSHGSTIMALTGISLDTAEMVVVTPRGDARFTVAGRLAAHSP